MLTRRRGSPLDLGLNSDRSHNDQTLTSSSPARILPRPLQAVKLGSTPHEDAPHRTWRVEEVLSETALLHQKIVSRAGRALKRAGVRWLETQLQAKRRGPPAVTEACGLDCGGFVETGMSVLRQRHVARAMRVPSRPGCLLCRVVEGPFRTPTDGPHKERIQPP